MPLKFCPLNRLSRRWRRCARSCVDGTRDRRAGLPRLPMPGRRPSGWCKDFFLCQTNARPTTTFIFVCSHTFDTFWRFFLSITPAIADRSGEGGAFSCALPPSFALPLFPYKAAHRPAGGIGRLGWPARAGQAWPARSAGRPSRPGSSVATLDSKRGPLDTNGANSVGF